MLGAIQRLAAQLAATPVTTAATEQLGGVVAAIANVFHRLRARRARTWEKREENVRDGNRPGRVFSGGAGVSNW